MVEQDETMVVGESDLRDAHAVHSKRVAVIGAARSGLAAAELLRHEGARVFVSDSGNEQSLAAARERLRALEIPFETGGHSGQVFDADLIVASPGVPSDAPVLREAVRRGVRVVSELEMASWFCRAPIIAVTGTNGKTTTTTLIGRMLHDDKRKHAVAGNIGTAFSAIVGSLDPSSLAVLEVSSFQLDGIETFRPHVAIILNITPDHLDRYDHDFEKYIASKCRVFEHQAAEDVLIYNHDDKVTRERVLPMASGRVRLLGFGRGEEFEEGAFLDHGVLTTLLGGVRSEIVPADQISIRGMHNLYNSMAAVLAARVVGVNPPSLRATLRNFKGVEHRLEFVREVNGVKYVNDSKATNVDSVWYALQSFGEPLVVLMGGRDKGNDYTSLLGLVKDHVRAIVAIGESAEKVLRSFSPVANVVVAHTMEEAVRTAASLAMAGDVVLLSPACASFDWFRNYEHRGEVFKEIVRSL